MPIAQKHFKGTAIQLAKRDSLKVITSADSDDTVAFMKEIGVDVAFDYPPINLTDQQHTQSTTHSVSQSFTHTHSPSGSMQHLLSSPMFASVGSTLNGPPSSTLAGPRSLESPRTATFTSPCVSRVSRSSRRQSRVQAWIERAGLVVTAALGLSA